MTEKEFWMININKQKDRAHSRPFRIKLETLNLEIVDMILQFWLYVSHTFHTYNAFNLT